MTFRKSLDKLTPNEKIDHLRQKWAELLGDINPKSDPSIRISKDQTNNDICVERILLEIDDVYFLFTRIVLGYIRTHA